ncbi:N-6 DNA methylase [Amycolatopsis sacchari]|uniref:N-6 DNA methylase n=1 Tax=Amycolatopsis sacchari TaxID=115433 RepID=UPI003EB7432E
MTTRGASATAVRVAEAVAGEWYGADSSGRLDVPFGVVATLALVNLPVSDHDVAGQLRALGQRDFACWARGVWRSVLNARPDLVHLVYPLMGWLFDAGEAVEATAKSVADAALAAGQLDVTGTLERFDVDLLGIVLTALKAGGATKARAQIYTPTDVADAVAALQFADAEIRFGQSVCDPAVGTGGLFRAAAKILLSRGFDPGDLVWMGCDVDELAIAGAAVNSLLWGLGTDVLLHVGNSLQGDWIKEAQERRAEVLGIASSTRQVKSILGIFSRDEFWRRYDSAN